MIHGTPTIAPAYDTHLRWPTRDAVPSSGGYSRDVDVGPVELLIVLAVVLLLFGSTRLPSLARGMGQAVSEFKKGTRGEAADDQAKPEASPESPSDGTKPPPD